MRSIIHPLKIRSQRQCIRAIFQSPRSYSSLGVQRVKRTRFDSPRMGPQFIILSLSWWCTRTYVKRSGVCACGSTIYRKSYVSLARPIFFASTCPYFRSPAVSCLRPSRSENKAGKRQVNTHLEIASPSYGESPRSLAALNVVRFRLRRDGTFYIIDPRCESRHELSMN